MAEKDVAQHKSMAMGDGIMKESNFGTESPFKPMGGEENGRKMLKDHERGISRPKGFHPEPDHGPTGDE